MRNFDEILSFEEERGERRGKGGKGGMTTRKDVEGKSSKEEK